ncbi:MAG TPA: PAS domain S-box protein, partial [Chthoniobacterales bacterium]|nr:PAS domain S-box protein [Chthoniobacterales bacterium]
HRRRGGRHHFSKRLWRRATWLHGERVGPPAVLNLFYEPDRPFIQERTNGCFEQPGQVMRWEARKIRKNGTMLWVRESANTVILKRRPVLLVICEDITEQKRAEGVRERW